MAQPQATECWLCRRPFGEMIEWHHPVPKSRGGREVVPLHPICHRTLHYRYSNAELEGAGANVETLRDDPEIARFLRWVALKPPDFHAPTHRRR